MASTSPRIAVTTPTGHVGRHVGRHVVGALVRAGVRPLLLARDPARVDPALAGWVDVAQVDLTDAGAVVAAQRGRLTAAGVPSAVVDAILGMSTGLRDGFVPEQSRTAATTTPTTLAGWCVEELLPALAAEVGGGTP